MLAILEPAVLVLLALAADPQADLLARIERTELVVSGKSFPRIEKDADGNVVRLQLDGMQLSADEFTALSRLTTLRYLALNKTNVTAADLRALHGLARLEGMQLNSTDLSADAAADTSTF